MDPIKIDYSNRVRRLASSRGRSACQWVLGVSLTIVCHAASAQAMYRIKPLGHLGDCGFFAAGVAGLSNADQVAGTACNKNGDPRAFLWRNDGKPRLDLGPSEAGSTSYGVAINASGLVVGTAQDSTGPFGFVSSGDGQPMTRIQNDLGGTYVYAQAVSDSGQVTGRAENPARYSEANAFLWKKGAGPMRSLGNLDDWGFDYSWGRAINASGQVAVNAVFIEDDAYYETFVWKNDGSPLLHLGRLGLNGTQHFACCINSSGQIAGSSSVSGPAHYRAFLWSNERTGMQNLGTLAGGGGWSVAHDLNDSGQVVGSSSVKNYWYREHAFVWMNDGTPMKDLGTFGGTQSSANDINASGQVTGWASLAGDAVTHAFIWRNNGTTKQDLNKLIDPLDPLKPHVTLTEGVFINDRGNVLAQGIDSRTGKSSPYFLQGTVLTLTPRSLAFGNQAIDTVSAAKSVTVTNTSAKAVAITSIALKGSAPGQFAATNNCGTSLAGNATCTIKVTFKPTTKGAKSATLNVNGGGGGLRSVTLTGNGT